MEFYAHNGVPFVVGTTGGDREKLLADAQSAGCYAVIAPQMGKQVCPSSLPRSSSREQFATSNCPHFYELFASASSAQGGSCSEGWHMISPVLARGSCCWWKS